MTQKISGYRELPDEAVELINVVKAMEERVGAMWRAVADSGTVTSGVPGVDVDSRWLRIAREHFEEGFMAIVRAVAQPESAFEATACEEKDPPALASGLDSRDNPYGLGALGVYRVGSKNGHTIYFEHHDQARPNLYIGSVQTQYAAQSIVNALNETHTHPDALGPVPEVPRCSKGTSA